MRRVSTQHDNDTMLHSSAAWYTAANMQVVGFAGVQGVPLDRTVGQVCALSCANVHQ